MLGTQGVVGPQQQQAQGGFLSGLGELIRENPEISGAIVGGLAEEIMGGDFRRGVVGGFQGAQSIVARKQRGLQQMLDAQKEQRKIRRDQELKQQNFLKGRVEDFQVRTTQLKGISDSLKRGTAAGDIAAIYAYNKILDPGGRVTDKEVEIFQNAGLLNKGAVLVDGVLTGVKLSPSMRRDLLRSSKGLYDQASTTFDELIKDQKQIADREGYDIRNVIQKPKTSISIEEIIKNNPKAFKSKGAFKKKGFFKKKGEESRLQDFSSEAEIEAAGLEPGFRGTLNGRPFVWE